MIIWVKCYQVSFYTDRYMDAPTGACVYFN
jgi:hypothetical protein